MIRTYTKGFFNSIVKNKVGTNPISIKDIKKHLQIDEDWTTDDDYLISLRDVATQLAEDYCGADLLVTENTLMVFSYSGRELIVEEGNYLSGITISGVSVTWNLYERISYFNIIFDNWVNVYGDVYRNVIGDDLTLHYYTGIPNLPIIIQHAIKIKIADLYDMERNNYTTTTYKENGVFEQLLSYYKKW